MDDAALARAVVDPRTYIDQSAYDALFTPLRRAAPVCRVAPEGYRPFWLVTRHADIIEIERQPERFLNGPRSTLTSLADEEKLERLTGRRASALRTLVNMDDPDHRVVLRHHRHCGPRYDQLDHLGRPVGPDADAGRARSLAG